MNTKNKGIFITGTDTGVGKTWVTAGLGYVLAEYQKQDISIWKPVQSGAKLGSAEADSYKLRKGSGTRQSEDDIATYTYDKPLAPWIAARDVNSEINYSVLVEEGNRRLLDHKFLMIEGAGGLLVPLTGEKTIASLMQDMALPLIIIARPGLGTVNHTLLTIAYAKQLGLKVKGIILNHVTDTDQFVVKDNIMMIERFSDVKVLG